MPEPTAQELAPIFHAYGLAVYNCHLLEDGLGLLLSVIDEERRRQGLPRGPLLLTHVPQRPSAYSSKRF